jgi:hypothetical protein
MSKLHQKRYNSKQQRTKKKPETVSLNLVRILSATVGLFISAYLFELVTSSYFAPPPEYSQEYKDTYRQISEQDQTNP